MSIIPKSKLQEYKADLVQTLDKSDLKTETLARTQKRAIDASKVGSAGAQKPAQGLQ